MQGKGMGEWCQWKVCVATRNGENMATWMLSGRVLTLLT
jgi:hypothetical protein